MAALGSEVVLDTAQDRTLRDGNIVPIDRVVDDALRVDEHGFRRVAMALELLAEMRRSGFQLPDISLCIVCTQQCLAKSLPRGKHVSFPSTSVQWLIDHRTPCLHRC